MRLSFCYYRMIHPSGQLKYGEFMTTGSMLCLQFCSTGQVQIPKLNTAIMERIGLAAEGHWKKLQNPCRFSCTFIFAQHLHDFCKWCLQTETCSLEKILELIAAE
ncbi:hypothetical protein GN956_G1068 [Arapaima gigas]